jgi:hypothetical protein
VELFCFGFSKIATTDERVAGRRNPRWRERRRYSRAARWKGTGIKILCKGSVRKRDAPGHWLAPKARAYRVRVTSNLRSGRCLSGRSSPVRVWCGRVPVEERCGCPLRWELKNLAGVFSANNVISVIWKYRHAGHTSALLGISTQIGLSSSDRPTHGANTRKRIYRV